MLPNRPMPLDMIPLRIELVRRTNTRLPRQRVPRLLRHSSSSASVPDQLPAISDEYRWRLSTLRSSVDRGDKIDTGASSVGDLADGAVCEDAQILIGFAEV